MRRRFALVLVLALAGGCSSTQATVVRNLGIGLLAEGALVTGAAHLTRDSDEGIADSAITASPLLGLGLAALIVGEILIGIAEPAAARIR